mgnify:CR=1 FL=1
MTERPRYRRRKFLVNPALQFHFIWPMVFTLVLMGCLAVASVALALWVTLKTFELESDPVMVPLFTTVGLTVFVELLLVIPLVVVGGIWLTHKVAGPLVRIMATLEQMTRGDFNINLRLRKGDHLTELAEAISRLAASLRAKR